MPFKSEKQRRWMHANKPKMAKKWEKKKEAVEEKKERDYKDEYKKFQSSKKMKKYRAELNKYNRKKGTYGNGDGKDASHKGGKIVGFESQSKNRGRAEKSRLKKEGVITENPAAIAAGVRAAMARAKEKELAVSGGKKVKVSTALANKSHPKHKQAKGIIQRIKDKAKSMLAKSKKKKAEPKKQSKSDADFYARQFGGKTESINEISAVAFQGLKDSKGQMWDLFWREKPPYVIPFNKSGPKTKVKDIKDIKLKKSVLNVLKAVRTESVNEWTVKQQKKYKIGTKMKPVKMGTQLVTKDKKYRILTIRQWLKFPNYAKLVKNRTHHIDTKVDGKLKQLPVVFVDKQDRVVKLESVNEANNIDKIKDIVKKKSYKRIGGVIVDMQTANAILKVHKALNPANRKKYEKLSISKMADVAWKLIK